MSHFFEKNGIALDDSATFKFINIDAPTHAQQIFLLENFSVTCNELQFFIFGDNN